MKVKLNQSVSVVSVLALTLGMFMGLGLGIHFIQEYQSRKMTEQVQKEASALALSLLHSKDSSPLRVASAPVNIIKNSRSVASADMDSPEAQWMGQIGKDPWGKPYRFKFIRNKDGMPVHLSVWSEGAGEGNKIAAILPLR